MRVVFGTTKIPPRFDMCTDEDSGKTNLRFTLSESHGVLPFKFGQGVTWRWSACAHVSCTTLNCGARVPVYISPLSFAAGSFLTQGHPFWEGHQKCSEDRSMWSVVGALKSEPKSWCVQAKSRTASAFEENLVQWTECHHALLVPAFCPREHVHAGDYRQLTLMALHPRPNALVSLVAYITPLSLVQPALFSLHWDSSPGNNTKIRNISVSCVWWLGCWEVDRDDTCMNEELHCVCV
jgi:hypothetical protein